MLEVEQKFPLADRQSLEPQLISLGASFVGEAVESDLYFNHPARDFAQTDEALRLRRVGAEVFLTYKGPKIDPEMKTRHELEIALPSLDQATEQFTDLFSLLGFQPIAEVIKRRRRWRLFWESFHVQVVVDDVKEIGRFAEIEIVVAPEQQTAAQGAIRSLSSTLGFKNSERRSYLELLLAAR